MSSQSDDIWGRIESMDWGKIAPLYLDKSIRILKLGRLEGTLVGLGYATVRELLTWANANFHPPRKGVGLKKINLIIEGLNLLAANEPEIARLKWDKIDPMYLDESIRILKLGPLENTLVALGYATVDDLIKWAIADFNPSHRGIGTKKENLIVESLKKLSNSEPDHGFKTPATLRRLHPSVSSTPSSHFHFGARGTAFSNSGYHTLSDLADWYDEGCPNLPKFGRKSVSEAKRILESLNDTLDHSGVPDWNLFCRNAGITLLPKMPFVDREQSILSVIPDVIEGIIESAADKVEADILRNRLTQTAENQLTLKDLGRKHGVTRERIRQKQKKLLVEISNGLMEGLYSNSEYRFRPEFAAVWHKAEQAFEGRDELDASSFLSQLSSEWKVGVGDLLEHLPFIFAVLTNTHSIPHNFRVYLQYPLLTSKGLSQELLSKSTKQLPLGRKVEFLEELNITTVEELIEMFCAFPDEFSGRAFHELFQSLEAHLQSLASPSDFEWKAYYPHLGQTLLPDVLPNSPRGFLDSLKPTLSLAIELGGDDYCQFSREVLMSRSFPRRDDRLSDQALADQAGTTAANISRVERELNRRLRSVLIERNFSKASVIFEDGFLDFWSQVEAAYREGDSVHEYERNLAHVWGISREEIKDYINLFWSILTNHPPGKNRNWYQGVKRSLKRPKLHLDSVSPPVIVLRKVRRIH